MDPIADQFPWANAYNYAENEPVANIDLHGLQKFYATGGAFLGKHGNSDEERVVYRSNDARRVEKVLSLGSPFQKEWFTSTEFSSNDFSAKLLRAEALNSAYDEFARQYKNDGGLEHAMAVFEGSFTDEDGNPFKGYQLGSIAKQEKVHKYGGASVVIADSKIPFYNPSFWKIHSAIHTHPRGEVSDFSGIDNQANGGPRYGFGVTNDLGWSVAKNAQVLLAVPSSNQIATFNPSLYNKFMSETGSSKYNPQQRNTQIKRAITLRTIGE